MFYKFRSVNTNSLSGLANKNLWFDKLENQNDPFEGKYIFDEFIPKELEEMAERHRYLVEALESEQAYLNLCTASLGVHFPQSMKTSEILATFIKQCADAQIKLVQGSRICSFSYEEENSDKTSCILQNNLMWSHYASGLRGFCLVFDDEIFQADMQNSHNDMMRPTRVKYQDNPSILKYKDFISFDANNQFHPINNEITELIIETISTKSSNWSYEKEVRILTLDTTSNLYSYSDKALVEVVIGEKMPKEQQKLILDIISQNHPNAKISKAKVEDKTYNVKVVDYS
ncbi:hypothetical protein JCM19232_1054 [Vibrio ishigakensis]|uniref:DUF2971 domain-containing protein n=1 Tax=Vibrio ishigakensis TaxID=1481914 RepID=A0A0B8PNX1_9VIBR|nr:hypothetical protein JCM19232_1054 [Vibrio ishigakensis]